MASLNSMDLVCTSSIICLAGDITSVPHTNPFSFPKQKSRKLNGLTKGSNSYNRMWGSFSLLMLGWLQDNFTPESNIVFALIKSRIYANRITNLIYL